MSSPELYGPVATVYSLSSRGGLPSRPNSVVLRAAAPDGLFAEQTREIAVDLWR